MKNDYSKTSLLLLALSLCGCHSVRLFERPPEAEKEQSGVDRLESKSQPYDLFSQQRSWPDRDFDWQGWRKTIQQIRKEATESTAAERAAACPGTTIAWTLQGPLNIAGRVNTLAVHPDDENVVLGGFAAGGIFKTTDGGVNWSPVFDDQPELAISDITFDPNNPDIVYAATGDPNIPSVVFNGNGLYKSIDGGDTWAYLGLGQQGILSKVIVNPENSSVLYAAAMGNPYVRDAERGIYKSSNGGQSWSKVLFVHEQAGASDLVMDPTNPQILYASFWDRIRNNHESVIFGSHAKIYKTTNGGTTWTLLGGGLPTGVMGRTGLAISQTDPQKLYAVYVDSLSTVGGIYKTTNGGVSWTALNSAVVEDAFSDFGWYFGKLRLNPADDEEVYLLGVLLWRKAPSGSAWQVAAGAHADTHDLVFTPSGRRYLATDGGVYRNDSNLQLWVRSKNLPTTQFYRTNFNPFEPQTYWAGAQDNGVLKGNVAEANAWSSVFSADGFRSLFHPADTNTFWVEIQNGRIHKTIDGGQNWSFGQNCLGTGDRCNWDMPVFSSPHNASIQYAGTYRVYASVEGSGWSAISPDLTDGNIYGNAFHTISCLNESPLVQGKLFVGTSDGNVSRREPDGAWFVITNALPERYITSVGGSPTLPNRIFLTQSGFRDNDNTAHIFRSDNNGIVWNSISGNLPPVPVNDLIVLPGFNDSILFAATDGGVYFTRDGGVIWNRLGNNIPIIPVFDLERNPVQKTLVAATFARSLWTFPIDSLLTQLSPVTVGVSGAIRTESAAAIAHVVAAGDLTASDGIFMANDVPGCQTFMVRPYRNDDPTNGISTLDLALISKHILDITPLASPYKIIAADANRSNSVTTFDIVALRRLLLGIDTVFTANTSWRFVPEDHVFPNPQNPFETPFPDSVLLDLLAVPVSDVDFVGIKTGDVNISADPALQTPGAEERNGADWLLHFRERTFQTGDQLSADFSGDIGGLLAGQFSVYFDAEKLVFEKVEPLDPLLTADNFGLTRTAAGILSCAFEQPLVRPQGGFARSRPLFRVFFRARSGGSLGAALHLGDQPTYAIVYEPDGSARRPVLQIAPEVAEAGITPNPFGSGGAWLQMPETFAGQSVHLQIVDNQGRIVVTRNFSPLDHSAAYYLPAGVFPASGMYFWQIRCGKDSFQGKMVYRPE